MHSIVRYDIPEAKFVLFIVFPHPSHPKGLQSFPRHHHTLAATATPISSLEQERAGVLNKPQKFMSTKPTTTQQTQQRKINQDSNCSTYFTASFTRHTHTRQYYSSVERRVISSIESCVAFSLTFDQLIPWHGTS